MVYPVLLLAGFVGLVVMALLGFSHAPSLHRHGRAHGRGHAPAPRGQAPAHAAAPQGAPAAAAAPAPAAAAAAHRVSFLSRGLSWLAPLLSPLTWFSWLFGAGAAGSLAVTGGVSEPIAALAAIAGGAGFQLLVVKPIWGLVFRFESRPAGNLEACVLQEVEAVTSFNARGEGLVRVLVDGRSEDVLATLTLEDRARDSRPRKGDRLVIQEVDSRTNTCLVSRAA